MAFAGSAGTKDDAIHAAERLRSTPLPARAQMDVMAAQPLERERAEAIAAAIGKGRSDVATKSDIPGLRWLIGVNIEISLAASAGMMVAISTALS